MILKSPNCRFIDMSSSSSSRGMPRTSSRFQRNRSHTLVHDHSLLPFVAVVAAAAAKVPALISAAAAAAAGIVVGATGAASPTAGVGAGASAVGGGAGASGAATAAPAVGAAALAASVTTVAALESFFSPAAEAAGSVLSYSMRSNTITSSMCGVWGNMSTGMAWQKVGR